MHYAVVRRRPIENRTWGSEVQISEKWYPNIIRKCDNDRESYDDRKCDNDRESYRVPKKSGPRKRFLAIFSCWMVLYGPKQCCMIRAYRCAALDTPLAYIRKKIHYKIPALYWRKNWFSTNLLWDACALKQKCKTTRNIISNSKEIWKFSLFYKFEDRARGLLELKAGHRGVSPTIFQKFWNFSKILEILKIFKNFEFF